LSHPTLPALGWHDDLQSSLDSLSDPTLIPARVAAEHRGRLALFTSDGPLQALPFRPPDDPAFDTGLDPHPRVGDWVAVERTVADAPARIRAVFPRRSALLRQAAGRRTEAQVVAANLDVVFVVTSLNRDLNPRRVERTLVAVRSAGITPVVVLTKADLDPAGHPAALRALDAVARDTDVLLTSAVWGTGIDELDRWLGPGRTAAFVGMSGVGKSTLVNHLLGADTQRVQEQRRSDDRGKHTTTHRELFVLPGDRGVLLDTPGIRELQLWGGEGVDASLEATFADVEALLGQCRFRSCGHSDEPGCAVQDAIASGELPAGRWSSYLKLQREAAFHRGRQDTRARREESRRLGKMYRSVQADKRRGR
jgi:ribosome biogenesis GTPase